ncbi:MAG: PadR family transcriptional regulator [Paludibacteraceae bacterium]|nr:PadR family transcriptional regulator [Paludibacteraceae bacterium]
MIEQALIENMSSQMRKGILEYSVLLLIKRKASYTTDIIEELKKAQLIVVEGTLYPLLSRLKNNGILTYEWVESTQGPPRKYYKLTEDGEKLLAEMETTWSAISQTVGQIKQL